MKNNYIYTFLIGILVLGLSACDFEKTNTNPFEMTEEQGKLDDFALGGYFLAMQKAVTVVGTQADDTDIINEYQIAYHLSADVWGGYFGQNNNWYSGYNHTNNYMVDNWLSASYRNSYLIAFAPWKKIQEKSRDIPEHIALSKVLRISAWHKTADMFGPIPYKKAGEILMVVPYDSQQDVYKYFLEDLDSAIQVLTEKAEEGVRLIPRFDAIYAGNTRQWVKYANSLMLRLAMRIRYADPVTAKKYAELAVNHPIGVMTMKDDEAKIGQSGGYGFINNIETLAVQYEEARMSSSMFSYLMGYKDPRLSAYFKPTTKVKDTDNDYGVIAFNNNKYQAVPTGHTSAKNNTFASFSVPNIERNTPTYWMRASEIYFLRAEGALMAWNMGGDAESLYKKGIEMSFEENGIPSTSAESYIASGNKPIDYSINIGWSYRYSAAAPTEATAKFEGTNEQKLEKIMTQKWIAMYPNGQEAWSEWRRTGYPKLHPAIVDRGGLGAGGVRRMNYPTTSYQSDQDRANIQEAIKLLGGEDKPSTKLWWDAKK